MLRLLPLATLLACSGGTKPGDAPPGVDDTDDSGSTAECEDVGSWQTVGMPFATTFCAGCHSSHLEEGLRSGAPTEVDLDTLDALLQHAEANARRVEEGTMPPGDGPTTLERERFLQWLECGAPGTALEQPVGSRDDLADSALETAVFPEPDPEDAALLVVKRESFKGDQPAEEIWFQSWIVEGPEAWLVELSAEDVSGELLRAVAFDPPLKVGGLGPGDLEQEVEAELSDFDGSTTEIWTFDLSEATVSAPDPRMSDPSPREVVATAEGSTGTMELVWFLSDTKGMVANQVLWPDGPESYGIIAPGDFFGGTTWGEDFPLAAGRMWAERTLVWESP